MTMRRWAVPVRSGTISNRYIARARLSASHLHDGRPCERAVACRQQKSAGKPRAFGNLEKRPLLLVDGGLALGFFDDTGGLAAQIAQVIKLGATHLAA